ncbi:HAD family hydrolase [Actinoplanes palleronii]|uniref:Haloacid dehalogenase n=1 Tax=Actinoplanes palleronii TaxID=113570 RepID=A0ABQ4BS57_9ACTN|nr:HAD family hydrolase [Actinoplanes palleronii]GIE73512.1 haloacid dehalogenase [Actinoplanes palleronii]
MPLLLVDLDNTLIDRDAAFGSAVAVFLADHGLPAADVAWVMIADASGYTARDVLAAALTSRYRNAVPATAIKSLLDSGGADHARLADPTKDALLAARHDGWICVIVTNGRTAQQELKIRNTGLDRLVQGWVVSEEVGHKKPHPEIFRAAAALAAVSLADAWVVGDSPQADIGGAIALGLRSVWVSHGQSWNLDAYRPTHVAADVASAIHHALRGGRI